MNAADLKKIRYGGVLFCSPKENQKRQFCRRKNCYHKKLRYRNPPFLGGQRLRWPAVRKAHRGKAKEKPWRKRVFSKAFYSLFFYPGTHLATLPKLAEIVWFCAHLPSRVRVQGDHPPGAGVWGPAVAPIVLPALRRMKRGVVLNRNEQATIEVADRKAPYFSKYQHITNMPMPISSRPKDTERVTARTP